MPNIAVLSKILRTTNIHDNIQHNPFVSDAPLLSNFLSSSQQALHAPRGLVFRVGTAFHGSSGQGCFG